MLTCMFPITFSITLAKCLLFFCNEEIPFEAVGEYTQNTARKLQVSENPRRLLVGGVRARKIVLATPLLEWYMEHGLVISRVYQVVEFTQILVLRILRRKLARQ